MDRVMNDERETDEIVYRRYLISADNEDLKELLERHRRELTFFIYEFVNSIDDAEEIMLDTFAVIASGTASFSGRSSFKTWLYGIGRNLALKHLRKQRFSFTELKEDVASETGIPDVEVLKDEQNRRLYEALDSLRPEYRQALHLTYFEEMSIEEVAKILKKTKKQVYNLIARGKQALKEAYTE